MKKDWVWKALLVGVGVLMMCCLCYEYRLTHPAKAKTRALRISSVNAAPRVVMSVALSNTAPSINTLPNMGK
jgi:hypothetical protein